MLSTASSALDRSEPCFGFAQPRWQRYCLPNPRQLISIFIGLSSHAADDAAPFETRRFNGFRSVYGDIGSDRNPVQDILATRQGWKSANYLLLVQQWVQEY